jgi:hypothetical protein
MRVVGGIAALLVVVWVVAHLLYLGPIRDATEMTLAWGVWLVCAGGLVAALAVLAFGLVAVGTSPAWLRFVAGARSVAAVVGGALIVVGLIHYRDTEPRGEILWIVLGLGVLVGSGVVHLWVLRAQRRVL